MTIQLSDGVEIYNKYILTRELLAELYDLLGESVDNNEICRVVVRLHMQTVVSEPDTRKEMLPPVEEGAPKEY